MLSGRSLAWIAASLICAAPEAMAQESGEDAVDKVFYNGLARVGKDAASSGSGFLVSADGHVLTAWHVLNNIHKKEDSNEDRITYIQSQYRVSFNRKYADPCPTSATLVGASEYRDIAVLQVNERDWRARDDPKSCLHGLVPVTLDLSDASEPVEAKEEAEEADKVPLFDADIFPMGFPFGCKAGTGVVASTPCEPQDAVTSSAELDRYMNPLGLMDIETGIYVGMSGGPAVRRDTGEVVGMIVASKKEAGEGKAQLIPARTLQRALWTFGITTIGEEGLMRDYSSILEDILDQQKDIAEAIRIMRLLSAQLKTPNFTIAQVLPRNEFGEDKILLRFKKQDPELEPPERFDFAVTCFPDKEKKWQGVKVGPQHEAAAKAEAKKLAEMEGSPLRSGSNLDDETGDMRIVLPHTAERIRVYCVDYFNKLAELTDQKDVEFHPGDFNELSISAVPLFKDQTHGKPEIIALRLPAFEDREGPPAPRRADLR